MAKKQPKPGEAPKDRIPIFDHTGKFMLGHVGRTATDATVSRFTQRRGSKLGVVKQGPQYVFNLFQ